MFANYFKTAWRNLLKNKFYSLVNITGLTAGLAIGIMILLWVQDELSFDKFHQQADQIYRLQNRVGTGSSVQIWTVTNAPIALSGKTQLPEVKAFARITNNYFHANYRAGEKVFIEENTFLVDPSFFSIFDFKLIAGNSKRPFTDDHTVVLTQKTAKRYFGDADPIGKVILGDNKESYTVSGVIKDFPLNSSIQGDMFFPIELINKFKYATRKGSINEEWDEYNFFTYLLLEPGTNTNTLSDKLRSIHLANRPKDTDIKYLLQKIENMHLYQADGTNGGISTVRTFTIIALLILIIACINYVNLSTSRSMLRFKEVSMRKIFGAMRIQLFFQFIIETAILFLFSLLLSLILIYVSLPLFNKISGKEMVINFADYHIWMVILLAGLGTLAASSIYPAMLLSSFDPIRALKGKVSSGIRGVTFRKVLVVSQFTISVALITGTIIIGQQLKYIQTKDLGYDKTHVFSFWLRDANEHAEAIRNQLMNAPGVSGVTQANGYIAMLGAQSGSNSWDGKGADQTLMMYPLSVDKEFIPFFKLQLLEGRNFSGTPADSNHYILNETAVKQTGIKDPLGKRFKLWEVEGTIIGVVKDFHFASLKKEIQPAVFYSKPQLNNSIFVRTTGKDAAKAVAAARAIWDKHNPGIDFQYSFMDQVFNDIYKAEEGRSMLFNSFAAIAILISCLGLLGLTAYTAQVRTREIGVRKVLGASVSSIISLLTKDFIRLVLIAILIAVPVSWYAMSKWLDDFAYRTTISWMVFLVSGLIAVSIAILTISFLSIKAALANPAKSLTAD
ncbi:ABC transporter permease [Chitinophaga niabensis]|uniref:Putative ABC transport system permease protein n=1 Tax=Chitinophaga niabensis TaxID=536979 RepID=A0A1N6K3J6_9BACT|nr:ABC transporter permease [Chitinophaga niabensis]SIO51110.1 putative ABC transport system permease protein [Chitinophaga niabensis]